MPPLIGHADIVRELAALSTSDDPPHALLLAGAEGSGRTALALEYARLLNCERLHPAATAGASLFGDEVISQLTQSQAGEPCGECRPCRLIAEGAHPDIITLSPGDTLCKPRDGESHARHPESRDIRICQVRGLIDLVAKYPFEARFRMVIIDPAERLYRDGQAAHTILKTLEEPPGHTVFCLVTAAPEGLLETILSRCRRIDVRPVPRAEIETGLIARGVDPGLAARAAELSKGRPGRAIGFVEHPDRMGERERLLERCARVAAEGTGERFRYANDLAERWRKDAADAAPELEAWEEFWETRLRNGSSEGGRTDELRDYLDALNAISRAREQLLAYVAVRSVFELMLLSFPRVTLSTSREETPAAYA